MWIVAILHLPIFLLERAGLAEGPEAKARAVLIWGRIAGVLLAVASGLLAVRLGISIPWDRIWSLVLRLDTLFLAMPISWKGTLQQYVGRLHRLHDAKRVVEVYDYVDGNILMLARMYGRRLKGYGDMGYKIIADAKFPRLLTCA